MSVRRRSRAKGSKCSIVLLLFPRRPTALRTGELSAASPTFGLCPQRGQCADSVHGSYVLLCPHSGQMKSCILLSVLPVLRSPALQGLPGDGDGPIRVRYVVESQNVVPNHPST